MKRCPEECDNLRFNPLTNKPACFLYDVDLFVITTNEKNVCRCQSCIKDNRQKKGAV